MFVPECESNRKEARNLIKESGILGQHRGWKTAQTSKDPSWGGELERLASGPSWNDTPFYGTPETQVLYNPAHSLNSQCMALYVPHKSGLRLFTASLVRANGDAYYQGPAHAFFDTERMLPIDSDESVDDFEIDSEDENEIETVSAENEIALDANDFTCQYWSSDEGSEDSSSSSTEDSDDDTFSQSSFETDRLASLNTSARDGVSTSHVHKPKAFQPAPEPNSPATDSLIPFGTLHQWSIDKDWALVKVTISAESPISTFLAANPEDLSTLEMARPSSSKASVIVNTTSNGRLTGTVTGTTSDTRVPFGTSFQEVFSVQLNGPLADGDCGSVVIDASTGTLYGHIVSGCRATGFAQVMAAFHTMPELQKTSPVADTTVTGEDQTDICATVNFDLPLSGPSQSFLPNLDEALVCFLCASTYVDCRCGFRATSSPYMTEYRPFSAMPPFEHASLFSNAEFPSIETPAVTLHRLSRRACVNRRHVAISPSQEINTDRRRIFTRTTQVRTWFKKNIKRDSRIGGYQQFKEVLLLRWGDPKDYVHKQEV